MNIAEQHRIEARVREALAVVASDTEPTAPGVSFVSRVAREGGTAPIGSARHRRTRSIAIALVGVLLMVAAMVVILNQGSDAGRRDAVHQPATEPATTPDGNAFGQEINGQGKVFVAGPNGVAGWVYTKDLNYDTRPEDFRDIDALNEKLRNWAAPVHDDSGNVIGYWVTNGVGFVDLATYNSPDYDPDALREQRGLSTTRQLTP